MLMEYNWQLSTLSSVIGVACLILWCNAYIHVITDTYYSLARLVRLAIKLKTVVLMSRKRLMMKSGQYYR